MKVEDLKRGFDLDVKNPNSEELEAGHTSEELIALLNRSFQKSAAMLETIGQQGK